MPNGEVTIAWGDGEHKFNVAKIAQALELEEKCDAGFPEILSRLREGRWRINDVRETLRLGLIGGGMSVPKAIVMVKRYFDDRPFGESVPAALVVMMAAVIGVPDDQPGKQVADRTEEESASMTGEGGLSDPQSTGLEPGSDGTRGGRTRRPSGKSPHVSTGTTAPMEPSLP